MKRFLLGFICAVVFCVGFCFTGVAEDEMDAMEAASRYKQYCEQQGPDFLYNPDGSWDALPLSYFVMRGGKISEACPEIDEQRFAFTVCFEAAKYWSGSASHGETELFLFCKLVSYLNDHEDLMNWAYENEPSCWVYTQGMLAFNAMLQQQDDKMLSYCQTVLLNANLMQDKAASFANALSYSVQTGYAEYYQKFFVEGLHLEPLFELSSESPANLLDAQFIMDQNANALSIQEHTNYCLSLLLVGLADEADKYAAQICASDAYKTADDTAKARILSIRGIAQHACSPENNENALALLEQAWNLCPENAHELRLEIGTRQIAIAFGSATEENVQVREQQLNMYFGRMKAQPALFELSDEHSDYCIMLFNVLYENWEQYISEA